MSSPPPRPPSSPLSRVSPSSSPPPAPRRPSVTAEQRQVGARSAKRLGELLVNAGIVERRGLERALDVQQMGGGRIGAILVNLQLCTEAQIREALGQQLQVEVIELDDFRPEAAVLDLLPLDGIRRYEAIPLRRVDDTLHVALIDPYNAAALDDIRQLSGCSRLVVATCTERAFNAFLSERLETQSLMQQIFEEGDFYQRAVHSLGDEDAPTSPTDSHGKVAPINLEQRQAPVITLCNFLLVQAIRRKASDIHLEPYERFVRIRLRVDGHLHTLLSPPKRLHAPTVSRLKVMAEMDIAKKMVPQDGHIAVNHGRDTFHFRVSTLPTVFGEKCVVRLLEREHSLSSLSALGMDAGDLRFANAAFMASQGLILATGPTGSGKTTTLHAGLSLTNQQAINIVTLEDPVESTIPGVNHVQINERSGLSFASGLRSVLRQDPDVVFVGEMRDREVADIAIKAALTGHLVLSTLHTNGAVESLIRLEDMGVPRYLVADGLLAIIAQRLLRRICPECAEPDTPAAETLEALAPVLGAGQKAKLRRGRGCQYCMQSGYRGRVAVYEIMRGTDQLRELIREGASVREVSAHAQAEGMTLLYDAGLQKVAQGVTTLGEVRRVLYQATADATGCPTRQTDAITRA